MALEGFAAVSGVFPAGDFDGVRFHRGGQVGFKSTIVGGFEPGAVFLMVGDVRAEQFVVFLVEGVGVDIPAPLFLAVQVVDQGIVLAPVALVEKAPFVFLVFGKAREIADSQGVVA